jgi:hypothetical protein
VNFPAARARPRRYDMSGRNLRIGQAINSGDLSQLVIGGQGVRSHDEGVESCRVRQIQSDGRRLTALLAGAIERVTNGADVRRTAREGFGDSGIDVFGGMGIEQACEVEGCVADVATALGDEAKQLATVRDRLVQTIERAMLAGLALPRDQRLDVGRLFDLTPSIEGARMGGDHLSAVEHAHRGLARRARCAGASTPPPRGEVGSARQPRGSDPGRPCSHAP